MKPPSPNKDQPIKEHDYDKARSNLEILSLALQKDKKTHQKESFVKLVDNGLSKRIRDKTMSRKDKFHNTVKIVIQKQKSIEEIKIKLHQEYQKEQKESLRNLSQNMNMQPLSEFNQDFTIDDKNYFFHSNDFGQFCRIQHEIYDYIRKQNDFYTRTKKFVETEQGLTLDEEITENKLNQKIQDQLDLAKKTHLSEKNKFQSNTISENMNITPRNTIYSFKQDKKNEKTEENFFSKTMSMSKLQPKNQKEEFIMEKKDFIMEKSPNSDKTPLLLSKKSSSQQENIKRNSTMFQ